MIQEEKKLFEKWRESHSKLVQDGLVNPDEYIKSNPKVLLIMKEVNDPSGGNWDLREFLSEGGRWQTWNTVTRWLIGINYLSRDLSWSEIDKIDSAQRKEYLNQLCVINLKKSPGGSSSEMDEIYQIATQDRKLLNEQFELYNPDIIICGGTGHGVTDIFDSVKSENWKCTTRGIAYNQIDNNRFLFSYYHPQARIKKTFLYYGLLDAIRELYR